MHAGAVLEPNTVDGLGLLEALKAAKAAAEQLFDEDRQLGRCIDAPNTYVGRHHFATNQGLTVM